jgi:uncharacterized protein YjbI with pentapeptide repeats
VKRILHWRPTRSRRIRGAAISFPLVALVGALIGLVYIYQTAKRRHKVAQQRAQKREEAIQPHGAEDTILQAYIEYMAQLLTDPDRPLCRAQLDHNLSVAAQAQTLTALGRLEDGKRKRSALQFLYEARLIDKKHPILSLSGADLQRANLRRTTLRAANLQGAELIKANLRGTNLQEADLQGADLRGANLQEADLQEADLQRAILRSVDLREAHLRRANLHRADLQQADLRKANLHRADQQRADLTEASLQEADLTGANLRTTYLTEAYLTAANLQGACLQGAYLTKANLQESNLQEADLRRADLRRAELTEASLQEADLQGADLRETRNLTQVQVEQAIGDETTQPPDHLKRPKSWSKGTNK